MRKKKIGDGQTAITTCEIRVKGHLSQEWSSWFEGLEIRQAANPETEKAITILSGPISDQAALHGILEKIRDLNLILISVQITEC